jgi:hypothetical protein
MIWVCALITGVPRRDATMENSYRKRAYSVGMWMTKNFGNILVVVRISRIF